MFHRCGILIGKLAAFIRATLPFASPRADPFLPSSTLITFLLSRAFPSAEKFFLETRGDRARCAIRRHLISLKRNFRIACLWFKDYLKLAPARRHAHAFTQANTHTYTHTRTHAVTCTQTRGVESAGRDSS